MNEMRTNIERISSFLLYTDQILKRTLDITPKTVSDIGRLFSDQVVWVTFQYLADPDFLWQNLPIKTTHPAL
jgi:hypothetical protein